MLNPARKTLLALGAFAALAVGGSAFAGAATNTTTTPSASSSSSERSERPKQEAADRRHGRQGQGGRARQGPRRDGPARRVRRPRRRRLPRPRAQVRRHRGRRARRQGLQGDVRPDAPGRRPRRPRPSPRRARWPRRDAPPVVTSSLAQGGEIRVAGSSRAICALKLPALPGSPPVSTAGSPFDQLLGAGVDRDRVKRWVADGRLRREHHGVFTLGHPAATAPGIYLSAALAAGRGAVVSHLAVAHLMRVARGPMPPPEVTIDSAAGRRRPGIVIHRSRLHRLDVSEFDGVPITILPRAMLDLAPRFEPPALDPPVPRGVGAPRHDRPRRSRPASSATRASPASAGCCGRCGADVTLSDLEDGFLALLRDHGLPLPRTNIDHPRRQGRLSLARPRHHGRAAELPLPRFAPRVRGRRRATPALRITTPTPTATCSSAARGRLRSSHPFSQRLESAAART